MSKSSEIEIKVYIKYRFKNDLYLGSNTINLAELLRQNSSSLQRNSGNVWNIDKHLTLFDKTRNNVGAVFITLTIGRDANTLNSLLSSLQVASTSSAAGSSTSSPATSRLVFT